MQDYDCTVCMQSNKINDMSDSMIDSMIAIAAGRNLVIFMTLSDIVMMKQFLQFCCRTLLINFR